jgi:HEAT repeat protein
MLQVCGRQEAIPALSKLLTDEELCEAATQALLSIGEEAVEPIRSALLSAPDRCRRTLAQAAGVLRDRQSTDTLRELLDDEDVDVRLIAGWGLANMADPGSIELLMKAAEVPYSYERIKATDHLLTLAENLTADGQEDEARHIYRHLERTRLDPLEKHIREMPTAAMGE